MNDLKLRNMTTPEVVAYALAYSTSDFAVRLTNDIEVLAADLVLIQSMLTEITNKIDPSGLKYIEPVLEKVTKLCAAL